jgi:benzoyl-CoA-dihydrodiol lyase
VFRSAGNRDLVEAHDRALEEHAGDWLVREIRLYLKRTFKRLDVSSRSVFALIEPGSCFVGTLLELVLAADRSYMLDGVLEGDAGKPAALRLTGMNFGAYPMVNGLTRLASRFLGEPDRALQLKGRLGEDLDAAAAGEAGLVTFAPDDIDWEDEVRIGIEARAAFSPDALTGMEALASLRRAGDRSRADLQPPVRLAELDIPAPQCRGRQGRAARLRHGPAQRNSTEGECDGGIDSRRGSPAIPP